MDNSNSGRRAFSLAELSESLGLSVGFLRLELARGHLRAARFGRRVVIMKPELDRYIAASSGEAAPSQTRHARGSAR